MKIYSLGYACPNSGIFVVVVKEIEDIASILDVFSSNIKYTFLKNKITTLI